MTQGVRAPELTEGFGWLNTDRPLALGGELRGQVVVLDFWTYCCINCIHILPDLAYLEEKYAADPVTFIGVHSAKFSNEASRDTIRAAILRYEIQHAVVIDEDMSLWRQYTVRSWPTVVVIDPRGNIIAPFAGEGNREALDSAIGQALEQGRAAGTLADGPLKLRREANVRAASGLAFPGKVLADSDTGGLYIADSNHNRIVIASPPDETGRARLVAVVGSGEIGRADGLADQASFNHPQGLAVSQGNLYVADTENHLIRQINLATYEVTTLVGTGEMTDDHAGGGMGTQQGLNSPWDLTAEGSTLYVAMAGVHQIWRIDLPVGFARALAGTGRENIVDGPAETAALSQPSGICVSHGKLYFADSEVSAIRGIDMATEQVFTIIGEGLFSFGDVDGVFPQAKLQHPLGVEPWNIALLVADTYNHKIKLVDPAARSARTLYGTGRPAASAEDGGPGFFEPGGISQAGDFLFVADTNNHRIVRICLRTHAWTEVIIEGLSSPRNAINHSEPQASARADSTSSDRAIDSDIQAKPVALATTGEVELVLDITLPENAHLSSEAPWSVRVRRDDTTLVQRTGKSDSLPLRIRFDAPPHSDEPGAETGNESINWHVSASFAYCLETAGGLCVPTELSWIVPVQSDGPASEPARAAEVRLIGIVD